MSWTAAQWALEQAPIPKSDPAGRLVLAYLGNKADSGGRNAYPLVLSIAHALDLDPETVSRALKRLVSYGLVSKDGTGPQGQTRWVLHLGQRRGAGSFEEFCERHRRAAADRKARYRAKIATSVDVHDAEQGTVPDAESGTLPDVHDASSSCPRSSVVPSTTHRRSVHDANTPHNSPYNSPLNGPYNSPSPAPPRGDEPDALPVDVEPAKPPSSEAGFESFWTHYPRRVGKGSARKAYAKAVKAKADPAAIAAAAARFAEQRRGQDPKYTPHPATWLNDERWTDEVERPALSTTDQRVAAAQALKSRFATDGATVIQLRPEGTP